jgi:NAD(P)H-hydrate epimerase
MRILSSLEMAAVDRGAQKRAHIPSHLLMERAAEGVASLAAEVWPDASRAVVLCGPGNNGGDGLAAARLLKDHRVRTEVFLLAPREALRGNAKTNLERADSASIEIAELGSRVSWTNLTGSLSACDFVVDALFGTGLSRALAGPVRKAVEAANASGRPILSVDVPSGLSGDTGKILGAAIRAAWTAAIAAPKHCHVLYPARELCGEIAVVDIGIPDDLVEIPKHKFHLITGEAIAPLFPPRPPDSHKGSFGHLAVVAGGRGKAGAALLSAHAALRAGAGLVTIACPESLEPRYTAALPEAMTLPLPEKEGALDASAARPLLSFLRRCDAAAVGPGLGTAPGAVSVVEAIADGGNIPVLFDADALNALARSPGRLKRRKATAVITPHPGEAGRLLSISGRAVQADRLACARELARRTGAIALLKGAATLTADPAGNVWLNPTGSPALATAGSGDVLTGVAGAFLAAGLEGADAAVAAAFVHGLAGERSARRVGERATTASDLPDEIGGVLRDFEAAAQIS